jgi:hypothetical protein
MNKSRIFALARLRFAVMGLLTGLFLAVNQAKAQPLFISTEISPPVSAAALEVLEGEVYVIGADRSRWRIDIQDGGAKFAVSDTRPSEGRPVDALPDGIVATDRASGRRGWLTKPTRRYNHGVLGDRIEAAGLRIRDRQGSIHDHMLGDQAVFEDRKVRFWDVSGDGHAEIVVVRSGLDTGAQLAVFDLRAGGVVEIASSQPIGQAFRWLNPVGAADFDGDGRIEIAAVITPHLGAILRLFRLNQDRLEPVYEAHGFSNHGIGMRSMGLAAVVDANGDGIPDIVSPNAARNAMRVVTFTGGRFGELGRLSHKSSIVGNAVVFQRKGHPVIAYPLGNGKISLLEFPAGRLALTKH